MNNRNINYAPFCVLVLVISFAFITCSELFAQDQSSSEDKILSPSEETFSPASDLVAPWRETGCYRSNPFHKEPGCQRITGEQFRAADTLSLYDEQGRLWYQFSLLFSKDDYFLKVRKNGFMPFAPELREIRSYEPAFPPDIVILRMVGESTHWYKVEINEKTRATKFILKNDSLWAKTTWTYWLYYNTNLKIDGNKVKLLNKPGGTEIKSSSDLVFDEVLFVKAEGDWAYVKGFNNGSEYLGWIRWREGRDILVGCIFNDDSVPEFKVNADSKTDEK